MASTQARGRPRDASVDIAILEAAAQRLAVDGYDRMTIDDVARDAGVTRPTVYRRWATKDVLVIAAVASIIKSTTDQPTGNVRKDLLIQAQSMFARWSHNRYVGLLGAAIVERKHHPEIYQQFLERLIEPRRALLREILATGIRGGDVRPDIDVEIVISMFVGSFYAITVANAWDEAEAWAERLTETVMQLIAWPSQSLASDPTVPAKG